MLCSRKSALIRLVCYVCDVALRFKDSVGCLSTSHDRVTVKFVLVVCWVEQVGWLSKV